jgi:triosephosphate isomerase (TIM)
MWMSRQKVICGNWKMYKTLEEATSFVKSLAPLVSESQVLVYLAVPFTVIAAAAHEAKNTSIVIGAQNMCDAQEGAFTGEIAGKMLKDAGASFVILGHSERRRYFSETDELINKKVHRAIKDELQPIVCIGESLEEKAAGQTEETLECQLQGALGDLSESDASNLIIAYEPLWAIGTGQTATPEIVQKVHACCRAWAASKWGEEVGGKLLILYGGSVKPENISDLMAEPDVDGALVGTASLKLDLFSKIIRESCNTRFGGPI